MNDAISIPPPRVGPINAPALDAWKDHGELWVCHCGGCGHVFYYPRPCCPKCFAPDPGWLTTEGHGTIILATRIHRPNHPAFFDEVPVILAEIALPEGCELLARVVGPDRESTGPGGLVRLITGPERKRYPLPTFVLAKAP